MKIFRRFLLAVPQLMKLLRRIDRSTRDADSPRQFEGSWDAARRFGVRVSRLVVPVLCQVAIVLSMLLSPFDASDGDETEGRKVAEECMVVVSPSEARTVTAAHERRCVSHVVGRTPVLAAQRIIARDSSHGHVLPNGLRAPLRC